MPKPEINLLKTDEPNGRAPFVTFKLGRNLIIAFCIIFASLVIITAPLLIRIDDSTVSFNHFGFIKQIARLIINRDIELKGEKQDRVNILLLGAGGAGHEGSYLTDTIILLSFQPSTKKVSLLSIPRDLLVNIPGYGFRKINNAYAFGRLNNSKEAGLELSRQTVGMVTDQQINYVAAVDFAGFEKVIDILGGIDVEVEKSFADNQYPTNNFGIETISFTQGFNHFDGKTALKFVRSRHGGSGEGSDFARSRRQLLVILAVKEKLLRTGLILNPNKLGQIIDVLSENINSDLGFGEIKRFAQIGRGTEKEKIILKNLDEKSGLVVPTKTEDGAFLLIPFPGYNEFGQIKEFVANIFNEAPQGEKLADKKTEKQARNSDVPTIIVQNGTKINGLAKKTAEYILTLGNYRIKSIGNAANRDYEKTVIYDLSKGGKSRELETLKEKLNANVSLSSESIKGEIRDQVDFVIILGSKNGQNSDSSAGGQG